MRTNSIRRAGAVLLTVAAGASLLLGADRAPGAGGHRVTVQAAGQAAPGQATGASGVSRACQFLNHMMGRRATITPLSATTPISAQ